VDEPERDHPPRPPVDAGNVVWPDTASRKTPHLVEYALLAVLIAIVCVVAVSLVGGKASTRHFCATYSQIDGPPPGARVDSCGHWFLP